MREIGAFEAKNTLGTLLDLVERGEEVVITRRGKRIARLVRETGRVDREEGRLAAERIIANRQGKSLGGIRIKDLVNEGRP
ncbi:MAG: type II toxin-antitoxin system Phd/YefM family antitoxin [Parvibaculaceae bacterium]